MSEFGTLHMEFAYLSDVTGEPIYRNAVERVRSAIQSAARPRNLYPNYLNPKTGTYHFFHLHIQNNSEKMCTFLENLNELQGLKKRVLEKGCQKISC